MLTPKMGRGAQTGLEDTPFYDLGQTIMFDRALCNARPNTRFVKMAQNDNAGRVRVLSTPSGLPNLVL